MIPLSNFLYVLTALVVILIMAVYLLSGAADGAPDSIVRFPEPGLGEGYGPAAVSGDGTVVAYTDESEWTFLPIRLLQSCPKPASTT